MAGPLIRAAAAAWLSKKKNRKTLYRTARKVLPRAARFIKKNWRTPKGKSLLLSMRGSYYNRSMKRKRFSGRARSRSRSRKRVHANNQMVVYNPRSHKTKRVGQVTGGRKFKQSYMTKKINSIVKRNMMLQNACLVRKEIDESHIVFASNDQQSGYSKMYNYTYTTATPAMDFNSFLINYFTTAYVSAGLNMKIDRVDPLLNLFKINADVPVKIAMKPCYQNMKFRNNTTLSVVGKVYVMRAKKTLRSDQDPLSLLKRYYGNDGTNQRHSETAANSVLDTHLIEIDKNREYHQCWKTIKCTKKELQPGDEITLNVKQKGKIIDLAMLQQKMIDYTTGANVPIFADKGDILIWYVFRGGIAHDTAAKATVSFAGVNSEDGIDIIARKHTEGTLLPTYGYKHYVLSNNLPTIPINNSEQSGPSASSHVH